MRTRARDLVARVAARARSLARRTPRPRLGGPGSPAAIDDLALVRQAHEEWLAAHAYFQWVAEPELVDYAIALITAAERRYGYLLNRARALGLSDEQIAKLVHGDWRHRLPA